MMSARSKTDRTSPFGAVANRVRMLWWTAEGSCVFLPHRSGKAVMMVSIKKVSTPPSHDTRRRSKHTLIQNPHPQLINHNDPWRHLDVFLTPSTFLQPIFSNTTVVLWSCSAIYYLIPIPCLCREQRPVVTLIKRPPRV